MKTTDFGKYLLKYNNTVVDLYDGCLIGFNGPIATVLNGSNSISQFDEVLIFRLLDYSVEFASFNSGTIFDSVVDGKTINILNTDWEFLFYCEDENIEDIIQAFKQNELIGELNIQNIFIRYAKMKNITEKQAVCYLITNIDVPEIDKV